jgi:diguanylate cyclase (GGDEF)-like protein/putative nucleotidyltransferase with HDIG domain
MLEAATVAEHDRLEGVAPDVYVAPTRSNDVTALFAGMVATPMVLPLVGVDVGDVTFLIPFVLMLFAAVRARVAARRVPERRRAWIALAGAAGLGAASAAMVVFSAVAGLDPGPAFYPGAAASLCLLAAAAAIARRALATTRLESTVDALLLAVVVTAIGVMFVAVPGFEQGRAVLSLVFLVDLVAVVLAAMAAFGRGARRRRVACWVAGGAAATAVGHGAFALAGASEGIVALVGAVAWGVAGYCLAVGADVDAPSPRDDDARDWASGGRWLFGRVVLPLAAALTFPAIGLGLWLADSLDRATVVFLCAGFLVELVLAFGRQAWLLVENRRSVVRERALLAEAMRRNEELEALTGLATTMTQTLEEPPIIEQALGVLHLAARASSSALHTWADDSLQLRAVSGAWQEEHAWTANLPPLEGECDLDVRGGRQVVRLALDARGNRIGLVTLLRGAGDPFDEGQLELLGLLVDELGVALQNARDYREKLEQAIRDPLTGLYNRRYFFEALEKEVRRCERYGSHASLALFDIDDFKRINDTYGHATGDDVLRRVAGIAEGLIRPVDSFARIGGEEFALLMPETQQLDALLVAERLRTAISRHSILPDKRVTVSGGVSSCPQDASQRDELERRADAALYWAKRNGKDICAVASEVVMSGEGNEREGAIAHLYALVATIDDSHLHTRDHSENVAAYAVALGQALGLERERVVSLRRAALLHDIGKVAVAEDVLGKPGRLTRGQFEEIKLHPSVGATMLRHAGLERESAWVRHHHERMDGDGYPNRLAGEDIPLEARIIFVADSFEAMTSDRPYRPGMAVQEAVAELRRCAGTQFDPPIVDALAGLIADGDLTVLALRSSAIDAP